MRWTIYAVPMGMGVLVRPAGPTRRGTTRQRAAWRGICSLLLTTMTAACTTGIVGLPAIEQPGAPADTTAPPTTAPPTSGPTANGAAAETTTTDPAAPTSTAGPGSTTTTTTSPPAPITLLFTGDVLMHSPLWGQARRNAAAATAAGRHPTGAQHDFTPMFSHLQPLIGSADLAVCHLETPIAPPGEAFSTHPRYGVPGEVVDGLAAAGFRHCSTASNHTFDRGMPAFAATLQRLTAAGITQHGMAATPPDAQATIVDVDGTSIAFLSATYGFDVGRRPASEPWRSDLIEPDLLIAKATEARQRGAELVILSLHWGNSGSPRASQSQRDLAQRFAASGVIDLIVGHHAHVVQPIEQVGSMWVAYGLGNFVSNLPVPGGIWTEATRDGIVLTVGIDRSGPRPVIGRPTARPIWVDRAAGWVVRDVATARADDSLRGRIGNDLRRSWQRTAQVVGLYLPPLPPGA